MLRKTAAWLVFSLFACGTVVAADDPPAPVVLISIDGLKPDYVLEADKHGLKIPHLRRLAAEGAHASGVIGVLPTVTYPSHTTMVTGVAPAKHGILANGPFDPLNKNQGGWYWYAEDIQVPTLWDAAAKAGMVTASVDWPVTVGANITHNIAQYWRASTPDDHKILRVLSSPGLVAEAEAAVGKYPEGNDYTIAADCRRAAFNAFVLQRKKPRFHLCYFSGLDTEQHRSGPYSPQSLAVLEQTDELVGQVRTAAESSGGGRAVICVVSDHGFARSDKEIHLNAGFSDAGFIQVNERNQVVSWRAFAWYAGGTAGIMLQDGDEAVRGEVRQWLARLADENDGIHRIIEPVDAGELAGFCGAAFLVSIRPGYRLGTNLRGPVLVPGRVGGTHGYLPEFAEMDASFFLAGPGVPHGAALGRIDMRDIAPMLAGLLGVALPTADGRDLLTESRAARAR
jgi:predicted AlkP superfamily pyrophosphatase or phosphodiesterase